MLDLVTIADIMLGTVDNWNHSTIHQLNPNLASFLPNATITVVSPTNSPAIVELYNEALSAASTAFRNSVRRATPLHQVVERSVVLRTNERTN